MIRYMYYLLTKLPWIHYLYNRATVNVNTERLWMWMWIVLSQPPARIMYNTRIIRYCIIYVFCISDPWQYGTKGPKGFFEERERAFRGTRPCWANTWYDSYYEEALVFTPPPEAPFAIHAKNTYYMFQCEMWNSHPPSTCKNTFWPPIVVCIANTYYVVHFCNTYPNTCNTCFSARCEIHTRPPRAKNILTPFRSVYCKHILRRFIFVYTYMTSRSVFDCIDCKRQTRISIFAAFTWIVMCTWNVTRTYIETYIMYILNLYVCFNASS